MYSEEETVLGCPWLVVFLIPLPTLCAEDIFRSIPFVKFVKHACPFSLHRSFSTPWAVNFFRQPYCWTNKNVIWKKVHVGGYPGPRISRKTPRIEQKRSIHVQFASVNVSLAAMSVRSKSLRYVIIQTGKICQILFTVERISGERNSTTTTDNKKISLL